MWQVAGLISARPYRYWGRFEALGVRRLGIWYWDQGKIWVGCTELGGGGSTGRRERKESGSELEENIQCIANRRYIGDCRGLQKEMKLINERKISKRRKFQWKLKENSGKILWKCSSSRCRINHFIRHQLVVSINLNLIYSNFLWELHIAMKTGSK